MTKIDLSKGISIQVEGDEGRFNTISVPNLVKLAQSFQDLIFTVAKHEIKSAGGFDEKLYIIELSGFKVGSAIPQFQLTKKTPHTFIDSYNINTDILNNKIENLFEISNSKNYMQLLEEYPNPITRNEIVNKLHGFTNSLGNSPINIVDVLDNNVIKPLYKISKLSTIQKSALIEENKVLKKPIIENTYSRIGTVLVDEAKKGKGKYKLKEVFEEQSIETSFVCNYITANLKSFIFRYPLLSRFYKEEEAYIIKNDLLGILAIGENEKEVVRDFEIEFADKHEVLTSFRDDELSPELKLAKTNMLALIDNIIEI